jgi:type IV pilus assembly protein PilQ
MGDVVNRWWMKLSRRRKLLAALPVLLLLAGCASSAPAPAAPAPAVAPSDAAAQVEAPPPVEISTIELREGAPEAILAITADRALVWTGYRDAEDRLVVELPGAVPAAAIPDELAGAGFVTSVAVERETLGGRPLTRLVIATREPVQHAVTGEGGQLEVVLTPVAPPRVELSYEPLPAEEVVAEAAAGTEPAPPPAAAPAVPMVVGTLEAPMVAPPATGVSASRLEGVELLATGRGTAVRIAGDGEFNYSTFALADPDRFVVDLPGVINESPNPTLVVAAPDVERVRVAQFKPLPEPVSRVVFDLSRPTAPQIERTGSGLLVRFGPPESFAPEPAPGGSGAENGTAADAQGGSEAAPAPPGRLKPPAETAPEAEMTLAQTEPTEPAAPAPREPMAPPPAAPPPATSDIELVRSAEVAIQPPASAAPSQSFSSQRVGGTERRYVGEPITMSLRDADLVETLRSFAVLSGLNIVIQPGVRGSVTVQLEDVPWDQAFEQILKINGLGYELEGNIMRIAPIDTLRREAQERQQLEAARALSVPLLTVIKRLSYSNAGQVSRLLRAREGGVLSQRGSVIVDQRTNTLILNELPTNMDTVIAVIENLDIPEPQVMIEARIVETRKNFTRTLGIDWSIDGAATPATGNPTGLVFPGTVSGDGGVNLVTGGQNAFLNLALGTLSGSFNLDIALVAAENEGLINILSAPKVATLNNERASIQSGFQIPIQTVANNTVSVQFVNATLRLDVTPQVTAEGTILMDINIQKRNPEFALAVPGANAAPISTKEARTRVIVRDGGTTVIGGIYEVSTNEGEDRVPGLANVPIIGHLFKNRRREDSNNELLIFITPRVVRI